MMTKGKIQRVFGSPLLLMKFKLNSLAPKLLLASSSFLSIKVLIILLLYHYNIVPIKKIIRKGRRFKTNDKLVSPEPKEKSLA